MANGKYAVGYLAEGFFIDKFVVLFPDYISHAGIAKRLFEGPCISGGFYSVDGNEVHVWGHSVSAEVTSRPEDLALVKQTLGMSEPF